jgi:hypothetical protein
MGMTCEVVGFKPPTDDYKKKLAAYLACEAASVDAPDELIRYFDGVKPSNVEPTGIEISQESLGGAVNDLRSDRPGLDVDLTKLPDGVTKLRFFISY